MGAKLSLTSKVRSKLELRTRVKRLMTRARAQRRELLIRPGPILIVSHVKRQCGIHEYGLNIAAALKKSSRYSFIHAKCSNENQLRWAVAQTSPAAIIYNYYPATMPWLTSRMTRRFRVPSLGIMHEVTQEEADRATQEMFDYHLCPDPTLAENNPNVFKTRRLIPTYHGRESVPDVVTIGSFGFGFGDKGFERLIETVQKEFDEAKIVLNLPFNDVISSELQQRALARIKETGERISKPGIELAITHDFLSHSQLLDFLASNTLNAFFYDTNKRLGISSTIEYALAVRKPIAITKCGMFRHVFSANPSICIEDSNLKQIIANGVAPLEPFYDEWSERNFVLEYERIMDEVFNRGRSGTASGPDGTARPQINSSTRMAPTTAHSGAEKVPVLFVNYEEPQCGVYQYGRNLLGALNKSQKYRFDYAGVRELKEIDSHVNNSAYAAVIYNYHPLTLTFINPQMPRRYEQVNIAVMHEMTQAEADTMPDGFFQYYVMGDPTLVENNPAVFKTGRLILPYEKTKQPPATVKIGTFGFSVSSKGYQNVIDAVQDEFDEALIRIHIPSNGIIDESGAVARQQIEECQRKIRKPGIKIQASHEFFDRDGMLDFLAENTVNAFLYDYLEVAGISSSPDHAMAVRRPMAVTKSIMFRHLRSVYPPITIEDSSLREIIKNGIGPFEHLYQLWTEENILSEYESILDKTLDPSGASEFAARPSRNEIGIHEIPDFDYKKLSRRYQSRRNFLKRRLHRALTRSAIEAALSTPLARAPQARGVKRFNRILDNQARKQYAPVIRQLQSLVPEIIVSKIPAANIQQAFIFDAVRRFAASFPLPRILCVGSYDDSAAASLKKLGYPIEEIDPQVNGLDLNTFFHLPSTVKASYDIIFSTSVIEHVEDDGLFVAQIAELLAAGGVGLLTCDYNDQHTPEDPVIPGNHRFYTQRDLILRILPSIKNCSLVDVPHWECPNPDFMFLGYRYTFATLAFRKDTEITTG